MTRWSCARSFDGGERDRAVEGDEAAAVGDREGEEVSVGHLTGTVEKLPVDRARVEQARVAGPEGVVPAACRAGEAIDRRGDRHGARIARLAHDAHETVLGDRAGSPARGDLLFQPGPGAAVVGVVGVEQRDEDVDVEERPHPSGSSSRRRSIRSFEITAPRRGSGSKP